MAGLPNLRLIVSPALSPLYGSLLKVVSPKFSTNRTPDQERHFSRLAFFRFTAFTLSCAIIAVLATRSRRPGALLAAVKR
jgi:hypothetical protein